jgi:cell division septal protein FtsQ
MKRRPRSKNERLTSEKERRKKYIIKNVVKRGRAATLTSLAKWASRVAKVALVAAVVAGIYWCATTGYRKLFWENSDYALKEVRLQTDGSLTQQQALAATGFAKDKNIFSYDLDAARKALKALPQVENAELRRYLPSRIEITVTERKPIAWITTRRPASPAKTPRTHLIDAQGNVFRPKVVPAEFQPLPLIVSPALDDAAPGKPLRTAELATATEILRRTRETGDFQIQMADTTKGYCVDVTDQRGALITFGLDDLDRQLGDLVRVREEIARTGQDAKTINLMLMRNIPVTFMPPVEPDEELEALLDERKPRSSTPAKKAEPDRSGRGGQPPRRTEPTPAPSRQRQPSTRERDPVLRPFRSAA